VRANNTWDSEYKRYFGDMKFTVQKEGWVPLLPKVVKDVAAGD